MDEQTAVTGTLTVQSVKALTDGDFVFKTSGRLDRDGRASGPHGQGALFPRRVLQWAAWVEGNSGELVQMTGYGLRVDVASIFVSADKGEFANRRVRLAIWFSSSDEPGYW